MEDVEEARDLVLSEGLVRFSACLSFLACCRAESSRVGERRRGEGERSGDLRARGEEDLFFFLSFFPLAGGMLK